MKRILALLLATVLCFGLVACGGSDPVDTVPSTPSTEASQPTGESEASQPSQGGTDVSEPTQGSQPNQGTVATDPSTPPETEKPTEEPTEKPTEKPTEPVTLEGNIYTKEKASALKAGFYVIGGNSNNEIDDGTTSAFICGIFDSKGTRLTASQLAVSGNQTATNDKNMVWELISAAGGFYIRNAGTGLYLYYTGSSNTIYATANKAEAGVWKAVEHDGVWTLMDTASGRHMSVNAFGTDGNKYLGAAVYKNDSSTARDLTFYRLSKGTVTPNEPVEQPTEKPTEKPTEGNNDADTNVPAAGNGDAVTYVVNISSKKFHKPDCGSVETMSEKNRVDTTLSKEELEAKGYKGCGTCNP